MVKQGTKVILITGASSGIGKACAEYLHDRGHKVYGTSRRIQKLTTSASQKDGGVLDTHQMIKMDVDDDSSVKEGVQYIYEAEGRLDAVVNNAGVLFAGSIEDTTIAEAKSQFETNLFGVMRVCQAVLPIMRMQLAGYIVNISSIAGIIGVPFQSLYSTSKLALEGMAEVLRMEVKQFGIHVVLVAPGDFKTTQMINRFYVQHSRAKTVYTEKLEKALHVAKTEETKGQSPEKIAILIDRIIHNPSPRLRYKIGPFSQRMYVILKRILPPSLSQYLIMKYFNIR
jgi:NAD(P)-dependent dehydrogenase (short-subunit alcohol dehydrogenase family)